MSPAPSAFSQFAGHLHPLLVHLPIGFLVLLAVLEALALAPRFRNAAGGRAVILALALPAAVLSALCGWLLSRNGGYDAGLLQWHQWTGIDVAAATAVVFLLYRFQWLKAYRLGVFATFALLLVASHFGGSLTHGRDYLTRYAWAAFRPWFGRGRPTAKPEPVAEKPAFALVVQPMLQTDCQSCHGPEKAEKGLRLDSLAAIQKGGQHGPGLEPGNASASAIIKQILLPSDDKDHMPPEGKPQPTADDIALLRWWIDAGAPADKKLAEMKPPPSVQRILERRFSAFAAGGPPVPPKPLTAVLPEAQRLMGELGISIMPLSETGVWLQANASLAGTHFGDADLAKLAPLQANLRWLDVARTSVTDAGLAHVAQMRNLQRLHLERTAVTDAGLARLAGLRDLEYLNLYGTPVTDAGLDRLKPLLRLHQVYLWETKVTPDAAKTFADQLEDRDAIARWQQEITALQARIRNERVDVDLGVLAAAKPSEAKPVNAKCPVSGKDIDPTQTVVHEGKVIAFCCADCKAQFEKDPKPFLAKLDLGHPEAAGTEVAAHPINTQCPVSGKDIDRAKTVRHEGKLVAFCCDDCKAKFQHDPKPFLVKLGLAPANTAPAATKKP